MICNLFIQKIMNGLIFIMDEYIDIIYCLLKKYFRIYNIQYLIIKLTIFLYIYMKYITYKLKFE